MDGFANLASTPSVVQDVQSLREALAVKDSIELEEIKLQTETEMRESERSVRNRMSDEIVAVLTDAMSIMKKTGEEARNSSR